MNILFLAFEGEVNSIGKLAKRFKSNGHKVFVVSCDHFSVTHCKTLVPKYLESLGLSDSEFANLDGVFYEMNSLPDDLPENQVDWEFLRKFEECYCKRLTLLEMVCTDPLMSGAYHHRDIYYRPRNQALLFKYVELQARWLEAIFKKLQCEVVFTVNFQYFLKALAFSMAEALGIPYLLLAGCRIGNVHVLYDNFSIGTPQSILQEMAALEAKNDSCPDAAQFIDRLRVERKPAYTDFEAIMKKIRARMSLIARLKEFWSLLVRFPLRGIRRKHYRGLFRKDYFLPAHRKEMLTMMVGIWRRFTYFRHSVLMRTDLPNAPFVYFPLHLIPENSVLTLSHTFDEMECLFQLSKSVPIDWKVVVKVNPTMLSDYDTHPNSYYLEMAKLPNVQFISPLVPSAAILEKASAVACISGTALLEGAVFGKPGIRWGHSEFEVIDLIHRFDPQLFPTLLVSYASQNLRFYVQACFNLGINVDLSLLNYSLSSTLTPIEQVEYDRQLALVESVILSYLEDATTSCSQTENAIAP